MHISSPSSQIKTLIAALVGAVASAPSIVVSNSRALVAMNEADAAEASPYAYECELSAAPKATGQAWTVGVPLYWDAVGGNFTTTSAGNTLCGNALAAADTADTTGSVAFNSMK